MLNRLEKQLEKAKDLCHEGEFYQAYNIFKRYYDRIPFAVEENHVVLLGYFVRCLAALNRQQEIKFYLAEVEKVLKRQPTLGLQYIRGVLLYVSVPPDYKGARAALEEVLRNETDAVTKARCKLWIAKTYEIIEDDYRTCRKIISSIGEVPDRFVQTAVEIWKALLMRNEGDIKGAEARFQTLLGTVSEGDGADWYYTATIEILLVGLYLRQGKREKAATAYQELRNRLGTKGEVLLQTQFARLENSFRSKETDDAVCIHLEETCARIAFQQLEKRVKLSQLSNIRQLLELFSRGEVQTKQSIVHHLYGREYVSKKDDKLVYYHIHALRKFLEENGLSEKAVLKCQDGYAVQPKVFKGGTYEKINSVNPARN